MRKLAMGASTLLCAWLLAGCAESEPAQAEDDIDVAFGATFRDYASPNEAGPVWFGNSMITAGSESTTHAVRGFGTIKEPVVRYPDGRTTSATTGTFGLRTGAYGVLVQYLPRDDDAKGRFGSVQLLRYKGGSTQPTDVRSIGTIGIGIGTPGDSLAAHVKSDGYYRGYFRFELNDEELAQGSTFRVQIESNGTTEWETGLVAVHREGRPFFAISHNPDGLDDLDRALAEGANALGPDLMFSPLTPGTIEVAHPNVVLKTQCSSERDGRSDLRAYLKRLQEKAPGIPVIWDVKPNAGAWIDGKCKKTDQDYAAFEKTLRQITQETSYDWSTDILSVPELSMVPFLDSLADLPAGRSVDGLTVFVNSNDVVKTWVTPAVENKLTWSGLGISVKALRVTQKWSIPVAGLIRSRETSGYPKKINYWSVADGWEMRRMLDLGVDGLIADDIPLLRSILSAEPYKSMFRYADVKDSAKERFAGGWFCRGACSP